MSMTSEKNGTGAAEIVVHAERSMAIASPGTWGPEHMQTVKEAYAPGATDVEFQVLWLGAKSRGLDPLRKQIYFVCRYDKQKKKDVWASQVSIDGFRSIAEDTGRYDGQDEPEYDYNADNEVILARVRVYRKDISRAFVGVARWSEYVQTSDGGQPTHMWAKMSHTMLSKCAEALALRKAFPEQLAGLYTGDEMAQADNEQGVTHPEPPRLPDRPRSPSPRAPANALESARLAWANGEATLDQVATLEASPEVGDRGDVFEWRISRAEALPDLVAIVRSVEADPHERMRTVVLGLAEKRRAEIAGGVSGAAAGGGA